MIDKGYYYLKLKENFYDTDEIKILESMENGYIYSNILVKFYIKALKNQGKLVFNEDIPYSTQMLATITGHKVEVVEQAIKIFQSMHLIEILNNGVIYMTNMQALIGSISSEGVRKAEYRDRIRREKEGTQVGQCPNIISNSNSISNYISSLEEKDNGLEEEKGEEQPKKQTKKRKKKEFVPPTPEEVIEYAKQRNSNVNPKDFFEYFKEGKWVDSKGEPVRNWKQKFLTWENMQHDKTRKPTKAVEQQYSESDLQRYRR